MKHSLIFFSDSIFNCSNSLKDVALDKFVSNIIDDTKKQKYILKILSNPLINKNDIIKRQEIIKDFYYNPELFTSLNNIFNQIDSLSEEFFNIPKKNYKISQNATNEMIFNDCLKNTIKYSLKIISANKELLSTLSKFNINSKILNNIKNELTKLINEKYYILFEEKCNILLNADFSNIDLIFDLKLNDNLKLQSFEFHSLNNTSSLKNNSLFRKKTHINFNEFSILINTATTNQINEFLIESINKLVEIIYTISNTLYNNIFGYSTELIFYHFALSFLTLCSKNNISYSFPIVLEKESLSFSCKKLSDPYLFSHFIKTFGSANALIPNDIDLNKSKKGMVIYGENSAGKTVYLRSIGAAQILCQNGLPVLSQEAKISIRLSIISHFAKEDNIISYGSFEKEVFEVSKTLNNLSSYSLILFNEIFQTTAYDEGAEAIYNIIYLFNHLNISYIFVTHILQLIPLLNSNIVIKTTDKKEKYRIKNTDEF